MSNETIDRSRTAAAYDALAAWYDRAISHGELPLFDHLLYPAVQRVLGDVAERSVLDLVCGPGHLSRRIAKRGAHVIGVDVSEEMLRRAREHARSSENAIAYYRMEPTALAASWHSTFDIVVCNMALVDLEDLDGTLTEVRRVLRPAGRFVFSLIHPCFVMPGCEWVEDERGNKLFKRVDRYFEEGYFGKEWYGQGGLRSRLGGNHRTLTTYVRALRSHGFLVAALDEPKPDGHALRLHPQVLGPQLRVPSMLVIEAVPDPRIL